MSNAQYFLEATYLIASCLFVLGLKGLSHPDTARRGMIMAAAGMAAAVIGTLFHPDIHNYLYIAIGLILGSSIGIPMAMVPMTAMPQRTALSHAFGALAASMVGIAEYVIHGSKLGGSKNRRAGSGSDARIAYRNWIADCRSQAAGIDARHAHQVQRPADF